MKVNAEIFLEKFEQLNINNLAFLIFGNELSLISKIENLITQKLKLGGISERQTVDFKEQKNFELNGIISSQSLFNNSSIVCIKNPNDSLIKDLENFNIANNTIIISGDKIKTSSKLQKYFELHKRFYSIACYKLTTIFKKKLIDGYINQKKFTLSKESYSFLVNYSSDEYLILENDLEKISDFSKSQIEIDQIKKLLSGSKRIQLDELFLQSITGHNKAIINNSEKSIESLADAYVFLNIVKNFSKILTKTSEKKNKENISSLSKNYLPKYLFKQKNNFETAISKANIEKIILINNLIQKTELFLRKNDSKFLIIMQRFLLNCSKVLK